MKKATAVWFCAGAILAAQVRLSGQQMKPAKPAGATPRVAYYIDPKVLNLEDLVPAAPAPDSAEYKVELGELHRIQQTRTPAQIAAAKADEQEESMFAFQSVLGEGFNPQSLPLTSDLGVHVKNEQSVAGGALKLLFKRPRPYQADPTLHPVCAVTTLPNSYPSGHALTGYLEAFTLIELVPEKRTELLARADEYAHNRLVCGVHYPSDIEESRRVAYLVFGYMLATPRFQQDLDAAKTEIRAKLNLAQK